MRARVGLLIACVGLAAVAAPVFAHHSFSAEYDLTKPIALVGTVTRVEWVNPHARFYMDVEDDGNHTVTSWELELGSPNALEGRGWTRNSVKGGDQVFVEGYLAKDGSNLASAKNVKLADGRKLFAE